MQLSPLHCTEEIQVTKTRVQEIEKKYCLGKKAKELFYLNEEAEKKAKQIKKKSTNERNLMEQEAE